MSRGLGLALLLCLGGAVLLLAGAGATWTTVVEPGRAPLPDTVRQVPGSDLVPGLRALGVLALAGVPALPVARRWGRVVLGALLLTAGTLVAVLTVRVLTDLSGAVVEGFVLPGDPPSGVVAGPLVEPTAWPCAVVAGGVLLAAAGLLALARRSEQVWTAPDRGQDPTR